jgi:hypothetical protein
MWAGLLMGLGGGCGRRQAQLICCLVQLPSMWRDVMEPVAAHPSWAVQVVSASPGSQHF